MSEQVFALPDLGEGLTEAEIVEWLVADGDEVAVDQHVVIVETAKAAVEVPCPYAGRVATRHGEAGASLTVGSPLITIAARGAAAKSADSAESTGSGAVLIGYGTSEQTGRRRRRVSKQSTPTTPEPQPAPVTATASPRFISPIVRKLAKDSGLDAAALASAGNGVIRRWDVESALAATAPSSSPARPATLGDQRIPLTGIRRAVADKLSTSRREIPDATTWVDVDATALMQAREALRGDGVSLLGLLMRMSVVALQRFPELNSSVDMAAGEIVRHADIHVGFAAQSPRGLLVPVVRDAGRLTTAELSAAARDLTQRVREGSIAPTELTGGTFTLNNYGVFGVDGSTPIINHPEAAMLGVGRIIERPWVVDGALAVRQVTQLSFSFDHRVCDGGAAGGFLRLVADLVENPFKLLV